jgi:hypothetical protein
VVAIVSLQHNPSFPSSTIHFVILAGAANSLQRVVVGGFVGLVASFDFPASRTLCFILDRLRSSDSGDLTGAASGRSGDRRLY